MFSRDEELVVYSQEAISQWKMKQQTIPMQIEEQHKIIAKETPKLEVLNQQLQPIEESLRIVSIKLFCLKSVDSFASAAPTDPIEIERSRSRRAQIELLICEEQTYKNIAKPWQLDRDQRRSKINLARKKISALNAELARITCDYLPNAELFLENMQNDPETLVRKWVEVIKQNIQEYEETHYEQESTVRECLLDMNEKLDYLITTEVGSLQVSLYEDYLYPHVTEPSKRFWQLKYLQLCGFLWNLSHQVQTTDLAPTISSLARATHIDRRGDLPDSMRTGRDCISQFHKLKNCNRYLYSKNPRQLEEAEEFRYNQALKQLQGFSVQGAHSQCHAAKQLAMAVESEVHALVAKGKTIGPVRKLYTRVLNEGYALASCDFRDPVFSKLSQDFAKLADHVHGRPSTAKKVFAAMALIIGGAIFVASLAFGLTTMGVASPISILGMSIAAALISKFSMAGMFVGCGLVGLGSGLFAASKRKGVSQTIFELKAAVQQERESHPITGFALA